MLLDKHTTNYLHRAVAALEAGTVPAEYITDTCTECGWVFRPRQVSDTADHMIYGGEGLVAMLVSCEGYWFINPSILGIHAPNWQPRSPIDGPPAPGAVPEPSLKKTNAMSWKKLRTPMTAAEVKDRARGGLLTVVAKVPWHDVVGLGPDGLTEMLSANVTGNPYA